MGARAVFLDRDGVINKKMPGDRHVTSLEEFEFLPGVITEVKRLIEKGFEIFVVTNQRGVARGLLSADTLSLIHAHMEKSFRDAGAPIRNVYACIHDAGECDCRKPAPGLILQASREHGIDLPRSYLIGDRAYDIEAGRRAGCRTILLESYTTPEEERLAPADYRTAHMRDAVSWILRDRVAEA